jgi:hypothetical protein
MYYYIVKIFLPVIVISLLTLLSERKPKLGGLLSGLPIGAGILIFFYGIEQGIDFVAQGIPYGIAGITSSFTFAIGFYFGGRYFQSQRLLNILSAFTLGFIAFSISSYLISLLILNLYFSIVIVVIGMISTQLFFRNIPIDVKNVANNASWISIILRSIFVAILILTLTAVAGTIGARWSGIFASFPAGLCSMLIILIWLYKDKVYPTVLRNFALGETSLIVFYIVILSITSTVGILLGTFIGYLVVFVYMFILSKIKFTKK